MAYATLDQLKAYLGITLVDDDDLLTDFLERAQARIDRATGRTFEAGADTTLYFDASSVYGADLYLQFPLVEVTSITNGDGVGIPVDDVQPVPYNVKPWHMLRFKGSSSAAWVASPALIAVTGKWAYSEQAEPDIQQATLRLAAWFYRQKDNHADMDRAQVVGDVTIMPAQLPQDVTDLLFPYRRLVP
jgi:hypothetical protein